jgi:hypothetical protein
MRKLMLAISVFSLGFSSVPFYGAQAQVHDICHGEYIQTCRLHPFTEQEICTEGNGVGGADPQASCQRLCGAPMGPKCSTVRLQAPIDGNYCGYSWFRVTCQ